MLDRKRAEFYNDTVIDKWEDTDYVAIMPTNVNQWRPVWHVA